jgi:hypothetical protein
LKLHQNKKDTRTHSGKYTAQNSYAYIFVYGHNEVVFIITWFYFGFSELLVHLLIGFFLPEYNYFELD